VVVAFVHLESELTKVLVALTIASIKAAFVALYFMHLKFEGKLIYLILLLPVFLCIVLVISLIPDIVHALGFDVPPSYSGQP
jgi:cytochrome c oxidase subunit 4